ncbi:MAG TPA: PmoA family protein [Pirellulales bacterium]|jgi:hypothetical protein|nr:PmoA family protein [Pirellulales bacterium]
MTRLLLCALRPLAVFSALSLLAALEAAELAVVKSGRGVAVNADGKLFTEYLIATGPKPILWPIIGPTGVAMTRAFPMELVDGEKQDHPHQRSFWFTHGNVNGVDFWSENDNHGTIVHREFREVSAGKEMAVISTRNDWLGPDGKKQLEDQQTLTFRVAGERRTIDFDIKLVASDGPVTFGDTKEGTMGVRIPTVMDLASEKGGHIITSEGLTDRTAWGKPASWVDYHGPIDGAQVGIAVMNHPSSFRYPTRWHVRDYGLFAANPFGLREFEGNERLDAAHTLPAGESIGLRYRFVFHQGDEKAARIAEAFADYAQEPKP